MAKLLFTDIITKLTVANSGSGNGVLKSIVPENNSKDVKLDQKLEIKFNFNLDTTTKGTIQIGSVTFSGNDITNVASSTITVNPGTKLASNTTYTGIKVSGFIGNNTSAGIGATIYYENTSYSFKTK